jgi:hypothetical protein
MRNYTFIFIPLKGNQLDQGDKPKEEGKQSPQNEQRTSPKKKATYFKLEHLWIEELILNSKCLKRPQGSGKSKSTPASPKKTKRKLGQGKESHEMNTKFELVEKSNLMCSLNYLNLENSAGLSAIEQCLPKVWSNPQISDHIR